MGNHSWMTPLLACIIFNLSHFFPFIPHHGGGRSHFNIFVDSSITKKNESLPWSWCQIIPWPISINHTWTLPILISKRWRSSNFIHCTASRKKETRNSTGLILKLTTPLKKQKKHVRSIILTKSMYPSGKVRNFATKTETHSFGQQIRLWMVVNTTIQKE